MRARYVLWLLVAGCGDPAVPPLTRVTGPSDQASASTGPRPSPGTSSSAMSPSPSTSPTPLPVPDGFYPRVLERSNGTIVASVVRNLGTRMGAAFFESTDAGRSFTPIGDLDDPINDGGLCCGTLFELPRPLGALAAHSLLWSASAGGDDPDAPMALPIWSSGDGGRTWTLLSTITATEPRRNGGLWEPEFTQLDDGTLVMHWSDETDPAHSQKLIAARTSDGVTWRDLHDTVALAPFGDRPGMANVRRAPDGSYAMSYEICGLAGDSCTAFIRPSSDGWTFGDAQDAGNRVTSSGGQFFRHAPTLAAANGCFVMTGQLLFDASGAISKDNGAALFVSSGGGWSSVPAPVPVPDAFDNFCPNYSSSIVSLENGTVALELASRWDGAMCRTYFARGLIVDSP